MPHSIPQFGDVERAHRLISPHIKNTPVLTSSYFNGQFSGDFYFKCENFQKVGAFKFRGACNAVLSLPKSEGSRGVVTHSSGNHAQAVALAAKISGYPATIVMPENAPKVKKEAVKNYGADIVFCEPSIRSREETALLVSKKTGAIFIHPYNNPFVISGQATAAKELLGAHPDLDTILVPVGGGGLISGTALAAKHLKPKISVIGVEPVLADDAWRSFRAGSIQPVLQTDTIADGLRTSLGELTFKMIRSLVDDIVTVPEASIIRDMKTVWERMKIIIEPSSAVVISAIADGKIDVAGKKTGMILTGGNVDLDHLPW